MLAAVLIGMLLLLVSASVGGTAMQQPTADAWAAAPDADITHIPNCINSCALQELSSFMALQKDEELVIDNSPEGDLLKISFNIR